MHDSCSKRGAAGATLLRRLNVAGPEWALNEHPRPPTWSRIDTEIHRVSLRVGDQLLHYRIVAKLGEGGMGVVWRAEDTSLDRHVAIKVLPTAMAATPDRLARFEREAKLLAALNHPGIASIYSVHQLPASESGLPPFRFLAMELVEGEELAARMARGAVPLDEALEIARQIAVALEAAHERGVIHRDLKPANVKLTAAGKVKVLDFGLAKALDEGHSTGVADPGLSPTVTSAGTIAGTILGTAAYMSPEQAKGLPADRRSDVWAFGVILYEMLSGSRAFAAASVSETLAAVLNKQPDLDALRPDVPRHVRRVLARCLSKNPDTRFHHIADARLELSADDRPDVTEPRRLTRRSPGVGWMAAATLVAAVALFSGWLLGHRPATGGSRGPVRFEIAPPENTHFQFASMAVSPDGQRIAFVCARSPLERSLWVRALDSNQPQPVPGTDGARYPFWSPDGRRIGFYAGSELRTVDLDSGRVTSLCATGSDYGSGTWNADGVIVFASPERKGLYRVTDTGGVPTRVVAPEGGEFLVAWPWFLPDGRHFLYLAMGGDGMRHAIGDLDGRSWTLRRQPTQRGASSILYADPGYVLYIHDGSLMAQRLDVDRKSLIGEAVRVADGLGAYGPGRTFVSVSSTRTLAFGIPDRLGTARLTWFDRAGNAQASAAPGAPHDTIALSPDGHSVAS